MIKIKLRDEIKEYEGGVTAKKIAEDISAGLARVALAAKIDGEVKDLSFPIEKDTEVEILTFDAEGGKKAYWHTSSHILAQAVKRLYPGARLAIGPAIESGFYYDIDVEKPFTPEDLEKIEAEMKKIIAENLPLARFTKPRDEAIEYFKEKDDPYKVELIKDLPEGAEISFYTQGEFTDLCAGPHVESTGKVKAVKLLTVTGAYWRGDSSKKMLQRIYGISFPKASELSEYLERVEEAKRRDHRRLGRELDLFELCDEGPGFPFFLPKGMILRNELENFWKKLHREWGYEEIRTPIILNEALWHQSGHWDHYKENMYLTKIDGENYAVKPMNCPGSILVYRRGLHSYRDLPIRMAELGLVHRHELSGALHGLMRVRCFTQDDAHLYMTPEQVNEEVKGVIRLIEEVYKVFGFKYRVELSTRPENSMGTKEQWDSATDALREALEEGQIPYRINEGDGAFYGPKIDFHLEDSLGRTWQCGTIQLDFQMPERFDLSYIGADNEKHRPVMVHRTAFGSIERFIAILIEHFAGAFPAWLAPVQAVLIPISERQQGYAQEVCEKLSKAGIRAEVDLRSEKMGYKIREAQLKKIPYMLVVGDKEMESGSVAVRTRKAEDKGALPVEDFIRDLLEEIKERAL